jgi:hypothetical protein
MLKLKKKNYERLLNIMKQVCESGRESPIGLYPGNLFNLLKSGYSQVAMVAFLPNPSLIILGGHSSVNNQIGIYGPKR